MARIKIELSTSGKGSVIDMKTGEPVKTPVLPIICERIKHYRELTGMEQKSLAAKVGVTANSVSNWENGRSRPDVNLLPSICEALNITLYDLFHLEDPTLKFTPRQLELLDRYEHLSNGHKYAIDQMLVSLRKIEKAENCPDLTKLIRFDRPLAAGIGDPTEFEDAGEEYYVYMTPDVMKADCIFKVNGDSMEPDFRSGDEVLVQRIPNGLDLQYGEIGAFIVGNEMYIKIYEEDGLHSINDRYAPIRFDSDESCYLIGRVISVFAPSGYAKQSDIEKYVDVHGED